MTYPHQPGSPHFDGADAFEAYQKDAEMTVIEEIAAERRRQIEAEGWSHEHDDTHTHEEMALAAAVYIMPGFARNLIVGGSLLLDRLWPWDRKWLKIEERRRNLIKGAALAVAEVERLDRFEAKKSAAA